jgi:arabinofuranosyltransferase
VISHVAAPAIDRIQDAARARLARAALFLLFSYVFLANAWLGDDAYITFRVVWNFVHGYGLTFNPDERVQAYTHPLWMFLVAGAHLITREFLFTVTALSWALGIAAIALLVRWARSVPRAVVLVAWLLTSKAFVDYTASGLEYPLSYLLLIVFYTRYLDRPFGAPLTDNELRGYVLLASLAFLSRPDAILLYAVPAGEMVLQSLRTRGVRSLRPVIVGVAPAVLWLAFATLYYGFPLPNTYYAKVANGIPRFLMARQGLAYLLNSISHDPITLGTIGLSMTIAWRAWGAPRRAAISAAFYVAYTVLIGGDFMSGRFFAMPFLLALMTVIAALEAPAALWTGGALLFYNLLMPIVPVKTTATYDAAWPWLTQNGIKDERGHYHRATNVLFFSPFRDLPDFVWVREGLSFRASPEKVTTQGSIGFYGLYAGPTKFLIDRNALADPLLARLPVSPRLYFEFYASHYFRDIPEGYRESCDRGENLLTDPLLHEYYDRLRNVTRGSVLRLGRLRDIWALNLGPYRNLHEQYERRRPVELSIRADNDRFLTDVGDRNQVAGTLRTTGRPGYLQYGPRIPLKKGSYTARWIGTVESAPSGNLGFAEVWNGPEQRLERKAALTPGAVAPRTLARIDFELPEPVDGLEYRFYVHADVRMTLERVELYSAVAAPIDP